MPMTPADYTAIERALTDKVMAELRAAHWSPTYQTFQAKAREVILAAIRRALPAEGDNTTSEEDDLADIASDLWCALSDGNGEHSEALDKTIILDHLRRARRTTQ